MRTSLVMTWVAVAAFSGCVQSAADLQPVQTDTVVIPGAWVYQPRVAEVEEGTSVTFVNRGGADHTVTFEGLDFDVVLRPGGEATYTFNVAGRFEYTCKYHPPDMRGAIIVSEGGTHKQIEE